jgi:hypothetical protein
VQVGNSLHRFRISIIKMVRVILLCLAIVVAFNACSSKKMETKASTMIPGLDQTRPREDFKIYADPSLQKITVVFYSRKTGNAMLTIFFSDGKIFEQRQLAVNKGVNTWDCYCEVSSSDIYIVKFTMDTIQRSARIVKMIS